MIIPCDEWPLGLGDLWSEYLGYEIEILRMTAYGDMAYCRDGECKLIRLTWFSEHKIGTNIDEFDWMAEDPTGRNADWLYPEISNDLPIRKFGAAFHFVHPLGLNGSIGKSNIVLLSISDLHHGMIKLWKQYK